MATREGRRSLFEAQTFFFLSLPNWPPRAQFPSASRTRARPWLQMQGTSQHEIKQEVQEAQPERGAATSDDGGNGIGDNGAPSPRTPDSPRDRRTEPRPHDLVRGG